MRRRNSLVGESNVPDIQSDGNIGRSMSINAVSPKNAAPSSQNIVVSSVGLRHYRRFYILHFTISLVVLLLGMMRNGGGRKYIPVNPNELYEQLVSHSKIGFGKSEMTSCHKAYINVHSSAVEEEMAAICCSKSDENRSEGKRYQDNLCNPALPVFGISTRQLPFATRLTRITEAWILPLLPILIRLIYQLGMVVHSTIGGGVKPRNQESVSLVKGESASLPPLQASSISSSSLASKNMKDNVASDPPSSFESTHGHIRTTFQRLLFYFLLLNIRGFILYVGANALEDYIILPWITGNTVISPVRTNSMSDVEHDVRYNRNDTECWYENILKAHHKSSMDGSSDCYGRAFDFSDHAVLFLAHYLPVFVMELLIYCSFPFWGLRGTKGTASNYVGMMWHAFHAFLFLYMHIVVLQALHHTAAYFHTPSEMIVGYCVSLLLQIPLCYMMCSCRWDRVKVLNGLPSTREVLSEKGD